MSLELEKRDDGKILLVRVTGRLDKEDYQQFAPEVERLIQQHGRIRVLLQTHDFHGWTAGALWEDVKFDLKHFNDIERLAVVGEKKWEQGMAAFCRPFTTAKIRFFEHDQIEEARTWIEAP